MRVADIKTRALLLLLSELTCRDVTAHHPESAKVGKQTEQFHQAAAAFRNNYPAFTALQWGEYWVLTCWSGPVSVLNMITPPIKHIFKEMFQGRQDKGYFGSLVRVGSIKICSVGERENINTLNMFTFINFIMLVSAFNKNYTVSNSANKFGITNQTYVIPIAMVRQWRQLGRVIPPWWWGGGDQNYIDGLRYNLIRADWRVVVRYFLGACDDHINPLMVSIKIRQKKEALAWHTDGVVHFVFIWSCVMDPWYLTSKTQKTFISNCCQCCHPSKVFFSNL